MDRVGWKSKGQPGLGPLCEGSCLAVGKDFVSPEDLQQIAPDVLRHRILLSYTAESRGMDADEVIRRILELVPVP